MGIKRGDIYYVERSQYAQSTGSEQWPGRPAIIVSNDKNNEFSQTVEVVYLTTRPKADLPTHIDIRSSRLPSVALCEQVTSVSVDRIGSWFAHCTDQEMQMIDAALAISLDIDCEPQVVEKVIEKVVEKPVEKIIEKPVPAETSAQPALDSSEEVIRLQTERDMYKSLYEQMFERLLVKN